MRTWVAVLRATWLVASTLFATWALWMNSYAHPEHDGPFGLLDAATLSWAGVAGLIVAVGAALILASMAAARVIGQWAWSILPALVCSVLWVLLSVDGA